MNIQTLPLHAGVFAAKSQWTPDQLASTWCQLEVQISPFTNVLSIPGGIFRFLDDGAKTFIATSFMQYAHEDVMFCRDGTGHDRYFLGNPRYFLQHHGVIMEVDGDEPFWFPRLENLQLARVMIDRSFVPLSRPKEKKIPRPPNAYILYRKERHNLVKNSNPGITNNQISQVLGSAWNSESEEIRQKYKDMAEEIKQALLIAHPDYQYKPRKNGEKKKRARRNTQSKTESSQNEGQIPTQASSHDDAELSNA